MEIIQEHWHSQIKELKKTYIQKKTLQFLEEDRSNEDITTRTTTNLSEKASFDIEAEEKMIFVGSAIIEEIFSKCNIKLFVKDGDKIENKTKICQISGSVYTILSRERVALNLIQRLCGIATLTNEYVQEVKKSINPQIQILDTRKTTPGLRLFEKYAVYVGGGSNHRLDLSEGLLIKDNHIKNSQITETLSKAKKNTNKQIEIEVDNLEQLKQVIPLKPSGVLLDNFTPTQIQAAIKIIKNHPLNHKIFVEASGGITKKNLQQYLLKDLTAISIGAITHQAKAKNIKLVKI